MRKIWLALASMALAGVMFTGAPARADAPTITPDDRVLGKADAPVTIIEYFSLTCPHCADFAEHTFPKVKAEWIDTGKAKLVYRDYPLDRNALKAAMVARCGPPERYPAFVETLFQQQLVWGPQQDPTTALKRIASLGGISPEQFDKCVADEALSKAIVAGEFEAKQKYGVESTPTFFINGKKFTGAQPYSEAQGKSTDWYFDTVLKDAYAAATKSGAAAHSGVLAMQSATVPPSANNNHMNKHE
jgi:protein-disulfide isomerase